MNLINEEVLLQLIDTRLEQVIPGLVARAIRQNLARMLAGDDTLEMPPAKLLNGHTTSGTNGIPQLEFEEDKPKPKPKKMGRPKGSRNKKTRNYKADNLPAVGRTIMAMGRGTQRKHRAMRHVIDVMFAQPDASMPAPVVSELTGMNKIFARFALENLRDIKVVKTTGVKQGTVYHLDKDRAVAWCQKIDDDGNERHLEDVQQVELIPADN